ncbi:hypothetical protein QYE76_059020 [Lolium multiflorum]|uniref:Uncharacterized protein n=1 Tax=Lolium multiflorum TaxID=4521 RepID=A0AAD8T6I3_LOLMU|nr:hypothetical protein QYE76_059020 [Lolium multiflorum]
MAERPSESATDRGGWRTCRRRRALVDIQFLSHSFSGRASPPFSLTNHQQQQKTAKAKTKFSKLGALANDHRRMLRGLDDSPTLDYTTRFSLWQVKMRAILTQSSDLDEALDGFGKKDAKSWTDDEKRKDRKAFSLIQLHLSNNILQEVLAEKSAAALVVETESIACPKI